jgi:hypothetical protein
LSASKQISFDGIQRFLNSVFGQDLHAKRILSLAGATLGRSNLPRLPSP